MSENEGRVSVNEPLMIFCRVNPLRGITGGDIYDGRLFQLASDYDDIKCEEFILLKDGKSRPRASKEKESEALRRRFLLQKISALFLLPFRILAIASSNVGRPDRRIWFFNSSKAAWFLTAAVTLKLAGKKTAAVTHHPLFLQFTGIKGKIYKFVELAFLRFMDKVIVPSPYTYELLSKYMKPERLTLLPIPFDAGDVKMESGVRATVKEPTVKGRSDKCTIISIATIEPRKGQADIPDVMLKLKEMGIDSEAILVGKTVDAKYAAIIRHKAEKNTLDVKFAGYVSAEEKRRIMSEATVYVSTSCAEGYGISVVEAMLAGVPVVAYANTSMPMLLGKGRGVLCADGSPEALAEGVSSVLPGNRRRDDCVSAAEKFASSLPTEDEFDNKWHEILKDL